MLKIFRNTEDGDVAGEVVRYLVATGVSAVLSLALPMMLHEAIGLKEEVAVAIGLVCAMLVNFMVVRNYVFRSRGPAGRQMFGFIATSIAFRAGEYSVFLLLYKLTGFHYMAATFIALLISFIGKYFVQRAYVFERPRQPS